MSEQHLHVSGESHDNEIRTLIGTDSGTSSSGSEEAEECKPEETEECKPEEAEECKPIKYEYRTVSTHVTTVGLMRNWYAEGWEPMFAFAAGGFNEQLIFTLRRPEDN